MKKNTLWFKRKKYGWGWVPATWQGWIFIIVYVLLLSAYPVGQEIRGAEFSLPVFVSLAIVLTLALIAVSYRKGEKPRWSWGE